jgi:uncharacterized membrane protein
MLGEEMSMYGRESCAKWGSRFHAWQSALLFSAIFVVHLILSWSGFLSWVLFLADLGLICYLTMRAYRDGKSLSTFPIRVMLTLK